MINEERHYMVVKSNDLIQKSRFSLTTHQQKIILYLISKINYNDVDFKEYKINIIEFCKVCGIDYNSGRAWQELRNSIKQIADKSMWIETDANNEILVRWIEKAILHKNSGDITIKLDNDLKPYLLELKEKYTQYELIYTLQMKSKYSIRLYELLKSKQYDKLKAYTVNYTIDEIKKLIDAENYKAFKDFRRRALEKAIEEINLYSDINISYEYVKNGKKITHINFRINTKKFYERLNTETLINHKLDKEI